MSHSINTAPEPMAKPWLALYHLLLFYPVYVTSCWLLFNYTGFSWADLMQSDTAQLLAYSHLFFACVLLGWQSLQIKTGYSKLRECSDYEHYLNDLFDNRLRNRPAQNASQLEAVRKMRNKNSLIRSGAESYQQVNYSILFFGLLTFFLGSIFMLTAQLTAL